MENVKVLLKITEEELLNVLLNVEKPTFTNIKTKTIPTMKKGGNPYFQKITKFMVGNYFIGGTYQDMVRVRQGKEGMEQDFVSKKCTVGTHVEGSKCVQYNENTKLNYLQYFSFETSNIKSNFQFEGNQIEKQLFESYLVNKSTTSRQPQDNKHTPQSFKLSSIEEISLNGVRYIVER